MASDRASATGIGSGSTSSAVRQASARCGRRWTEAPRRLSRVLRSAELRPRPARLARQARRPRRGARGGSRGRAATSGSAFAVVASPLTCWRNAARLGPRCRADVLGLLQRGAAGGVGSLPAPNSGGSDGRRVSGRESLTSSAGGAGALAASRARAGDPGGAYPPQRRTGASGTTGGPWHRFVASAGFGARRARATGFVGSVASRSLRSSSGAGVVDAPFSARGELARPASRRRWLCGALAAGGSPASAAGCAAMAGDSARARAGVRRLVRQALADRREDLLQALGPRRLGLAHTAPLLSRYARGPRSRQTRTVADIAP